MQKWHFGTITEIEYYDRVWNFFFYKTHIHLSKHEQHHEDDSRRKQKNVIFCCITQKFLKMLVETTYLVVGMYNRVRGNKTAPKINKY